MVFKQLRYRILDGLGNCSNILYGSIVWLLCGGGGGKFYIHYELSLHPVRDRTLIELVHTYSHEYYLFCRYDHAVV